MEGDLEYIPKVMGKHDHHHVLFLILTTCEQ